MVGPSISQHAHSGLRRNYLSTFEIIGQSIGAIAPSATPGLIVALVFASSGNGTWAVMAFATIALLFLGMQINVFSRRLATPGALYVYAAEGLGPLAGVITGWALVIGYMFAIVDCVAGIVNEVTILLHNFGIETNLPAILTLVGATLGAAWALSYRDVKLSTRVTSVIEIFTMVLVLGLIGAYFFKSGTIVDYPQVSLSGTTPDQFRLGLVLAFFCFAGFETAADLGAEARDPFRKIPKAIFGSVIISGIFFIVTTYGLVAAFRSIGLPLDKQDAPLTTLAQSLNAPRIGLLIPLGIASSLFAALLGMFNAGSRVIYAFSHRGLLHPAAQRAHKDHATPHVALGIQALTALIVLVALLLCRISLLDIFGYTGTLFTFGLFFAYVAVTLAAPVYLKRRGELKTTHIVSSAISLILLTIAIIGSLYPVPDWPSNILPYIFVGLVLIGVCYFLVLRKTNPEKLLGLEQELLHIEAQPTVGSEL